MSNALNESKVLINIEHFIEDVSARKGTTKSQC
ncbi:hypothetical protein F941_02757 [Acinetobacter bouvetii DSM 14964 = CIP 107468]|uniref:Uncharacterized protein n=1 Tax=Acinetobacter bouvetii DSM 14964 = CIP 107468 TaxID=1120925 RepID=N9DLK9_9GAMM|nr:hypothetical protein F941_02757 [Acinetobacter bouvetii DSM 14964 = CIP 107468]